MPIPVLPSPRTLGACQRVLVVAVLAPAVLLALSTAVVPLIFLPFLPGGTERSVKLLAAHATYLRTLLNGSRTSL